jgi:hypothetical protein
VTDKFLLKLLNWLTALSGDRPIRSRAKCEVTNPALVLSSTFPPETVATGNRGVNQR